jgi:hypothetical protein
MYYLHLQGRRVSRTWKSCSDIGMVGQGRGGGLAVVLLEQVMQALSAPWRKERWFSSHRQESCFHLMRHSYTRPSGKGLIFHFPLIVRRTVFRFLWRQWSVRLFTASTGLGGDSIPLPCIARPVPRPTHFDTKEGGSELLPDYTVSHPRTQNSSSRRQNLKSNTLHQVPRSRWETKFRADTKQEAIL